MADASMQRQLPDSDPLNDATVLLIGRGTSYPALSIALGERMGVVGALSIEAAAKGGLPPTLAKIYADPKFQKDYPFADLIKQSVATGAVRPQTPAYADVSLAIYKLVSPASAIQLNGFTGTLDSRLNDALNSKGLF